MKLSTKHPDTQTTVVRADFSGGLNTAANTDGIAENQLSLAVNVEVDHATGRLRTVAGTTDVLKFDNIFAAAYDEINRTLLLVARDRSVYAINDAGDVSRALGVLNGLLYPISASWEDGLLLASGGKLQYFNGTTLETIADSPNATSVYIRAGRVLITDDTTVRYSGVGDETNWTENTNDDSTSKFVEAGYKDGGKLIGMVNLSTDVLLVKNNRRLYRLNGESPNWTVVEVSRNIEVSGRLGFCAVSDSVYILGRNAVQNIQTTNAYGDMKPQNVATLITSEVQKLSADAKLRYVPPLNQIWAISGRTVLLFDLVTNSWYKREFNSPVVDVISVGDKVFIIKPDRVSRLDGNTFYDAGLPLQWKWQAQRLVSQHAYLLKRTQVSVIPLSTLLYAGQIRVGAVIIGLPLPERNLKIYHNRSRIYKCHVKICLAGRRRFVFSKGEYIFENLEPIYGNPQKIFSRPTIIKESRNVFRSRFIDVGGRGSVGGIIFVAVILDIAEV